MQSLLVDLRQSSQVKTRTQVNKDPETLRFGLNRTIKSFSNLESFTDNFQKPISQYYNSIVPNFLYSIKLQKNM